MIWELNEVTNHYNKAPPVKRGNPQPPRFHSLCNVLTQDENVPSEVADVLQLAADVLEPKRSGWYKRAESKTLTNKKPITFTSFAQRTFRNSCRLSERMLSKP